MSGGREGLPAEMATAADRIEYLELLSGSRLATNEIVDRLDDSRSTVTRALRELREADLIEKANGEYTATSVGTMAATTYREYEATSKALIDRKQVLEPLDSDVDIPTTLPREATVYLAAEQGPFAVLEAITDTITSADRVEVYLPTVSNPHLLRVWHELVGREAAEIDVTVPPDVFDGLRGKYPELLGEMSSGSFTARTASGADYGLVLTEHERQKRQVLTVLIYADSGTVHGALQTDRADAVRWGERTFEEVRSDASEVTDALADLVPQSDGGVTTATSPTSASGIGDDTEDDGPLPLPERLHEEGFERISDDYFGEVSPAPAATAWQAGLTLADVAEGRAVERTQEGDGEQNRLDSAVRERLREGTDCVLIGPPGSGKSTICKQVACEWHERGLGAILYRERGSGAPFDSASRLEAYLRQVEGHALVVVEDVVRADANSIFESMAALRGATDVSFLFDARREEWQDVGGIDGLSTRGGALRADLTTISMPALDSTGAGRFIEQFEADFDLPTEAEADELISDIRERRSEHADGQPGEALLIRHLLARQAVAPDADWREDETKLADRVREVCADLSSAESDAHLDTAVLAALLKVAGLPVSADLLHSLTAEWQAADVRRALDALEGRVLFDNRLNGSAEYQTRHEVWATQFLSQLATVEGESAATRRFERCVTALLSLADDESHRRRIRELVDTETPNINQIRHHSQTWADETVERIFRVGIRNPQLAPLFGQTGQSGIEISSSCSPETHVRQAYWRGMMASKRVDGEWAAAEYQRVRELVDSMETLPAEAGATLKLRSLTRQSETASMQNRYESAIDLANRAVDLAESVDDDSLLAEAHYNVGLTRGRRGNISDGREHMQLALDHARAAGHDKYICRAKTMLATASLEKGQFEEAQRLNREALDIAEEVGDWRMAANATYSLAYIAWERGNLERTEQLARRCNEINQRNQSTRFSSSVALALGLTACFRGNLEEAAEYAAEGIEIGRERGASIPILDHYRLRSRIERYRGNLERAKEYAEQVREIAEDLENDLRIAQSAHLLAVISLCMDQIQTAREHLQTVDALEESLHRPKVEARLALVSARVEHRAGNPQTAIRLLDEASAEFREMQLPRDVAECSRLRALIAMEQGNHDEALSQAEEALRMACESETVYVIGQVAESAGDICGEQGMAERAFAHYRRAVDAFDTLNNTSRVVALLEKVGHICATMGDEEAAARWEERASRIATEENAPDGDVN